MVKFFDSTLRDGSHAIHHQLDRRQIADYCAAVDNAGLETIIVGHGNGLGASCLNIGFSSLTDDEMLVTAKRHLVNTKLGVFLMPGYGTIKDNLDPAFDVGVDLVCVASHCTEANIMHQHIEYCARKGKDVYGVLMMQHMISDEQILEQAKLIESYGALGVILMDSAGASLPEAVAKRVAFLKEYLTIEIGFHAHNNLGLAVANSLAAVKAGATIVDGTVRAFGAGAGNCQLEVLGVVLQKEGADIAVDPMIMMEAGENVVSHFAKRDLGVDATCLVSGMAGVFSSYAQPVFSAAKRFHVSYKDIFMELGNRKVVGGQEDMIVQVAAELAKKNENKK